MTPALVKYRLDIASGKPPHPAMVIDETGIWAKAADVEAWVKQERKDFKQQLAQVTEKYEELKRQHDKGS